MRQHSGQPSGPAAGEPRETAFHLAERLAALRFGVGLDEVGQPLDGGEIEPPIVAGAAREFSGLGRPQARHPRPRVQRRCRSAERRVRKTWVSTSSTRWVAVHSKKKNYKQS